MIKNLLKIIGGIIGLFLLYIIVVILHGTFTDYQPEEITTVEIEGNTEQKIIKDSIVSFVTWNVGFGGLGAESIFFYDMNGTLTSDVPVTVSQTNFDKNQKGIEAFVKNTKSDFFLLQEIDIEAKRSHYLNQHSSIQNAIPNYSSSFAMNYDVKRVPLPVFEFWNTMGKVEAGLSTYSKYTTSEATRYQFPGNYSWPTRIFQLDRCFLVNRYQTEKGKELVVLNTHNSAYDKGGVLKKQQMEYLRNFLIAEYEKGNYVVVGGDWNQCPPYFKFDFFKPKEGTGYETQSIDPAFLPENWTWAYDATVPTNRKLTEVFKAGETFTTLIDFFLVSPNLKVNKIKGLNQEFQYSDHQPVYIEIELL